MLKSYEVSNFKSFKGRTKFYLERTNYKMLEDVNQKKMCIRDSYTSKVSKSFKPYQN